MYIYVYRVDKHKQIDLSYLPVRLLFVTVSDAFYFYQSRSQFLKLTTNKPIKLEVNLEIPAGCNMRKWICLVLLPPSQYVTCMSKEAQK